MVPKNQINSTSQEENENSSLPADAYKLNNKTIPNQAGLGLELGRQIKKARRKQKKETDHLLQDRKKDDNSKNKKQQQRRINTLKSSPTLSQQPDQTLTENNYPNEESIDNNNLEDDITSQTNQNTEVDYDLDWGGEGEATNKKEGGDDENKKNEEETKDDENKKDEDKENKEETKDDENKKDENGKEKKDFKNKKDVYKKNKEETKDKNNQNHNTNKTENKSVNDQPSKTKVRPEKEQSDDSEKKYESRLKQIRQQAKKRYLKNKKLIKGNQETDLEKASKKISAGTLTGLWAAVWFDWTFITLISLNLYFGASLLTEKIAQFGEDYIFGRWMPKELGKWFEIILLAILDMIVFGTIIMILYVAYKFFTLGWWDTIKLMWNMLTGDWNDVSEILFN